MNSPQYEKCYTEPTCDQNTTSNACQEPKCYTEPACDQNTTIQEPSSSSYQKCYTEPACDQNYSNKTCQEPPVKDHFKKVYCENPKPSTKTGQYYKCCTLSPVAPTPLIRVDCCEKARPCRGNFCSAVNTDCDDFELTPYGKEFVLRTGKLIQNCLCVKLNGLQDSCKHSGCCTKIGCMNTPFPNCPPARLWKNEFICRNKQKPQPCSDVPICSTKYCN